MEQLISFFDSIDHLTDANKVLMRRYLTTQFITKGTYFYESGKICRRIGYVLEGVLRVVQTEEDGREFTKYFINEGHFSVDLESFSSQQPSGEYQEALTDCKLVVISYDVMNLFYREIPNFRTIVSTLTEKALLEKYKIKSEMITDDAITRYSKLITRNPTIIQRIPLGFISSYLGVTRSTLSRIRKQYR
jgi:CRP-like cAMP-binding protein